MTLLQPNLDPGQTDNPQQNGVAGDTFKSTAYVRIYQG